MKIYFFFIAFICSLYCKGQVHVNLSQLRNTSWKVVGGLQATNIVYSFSDKEILWYSISKNTKSLNFKYRYYITTTVPQKYDSTLVGNPFKGCYIVKYNPKMDEYIYYIVKYFNVDKGTMTLLPRSSEPLIGGIASEIHLKRVK